MNDTQLRFSAESWSLLNGLMELRKSVQRELDFIHSVSPHLPTNGLEDFIMEIDFFTSDISNFLSNVNQLSEAEMERDFQPLADKFIGLKNSVNSLLNR